MEVVKKKIEVNRSTLMRDLDLSKDFLTQLTRTGILDITDCVRLTQEDDTFERNAALIDILLKIEDDTLYLKFLECLERSGQTKLVNRLTNIGEEIRILNQVQSNLSGQLKQINQFLSTAEHRKGNHLTESPYSGNNSKQSLNDSDLWKNVVDSFKHAQHQLGRCKTIIKILHQNCETVAKQNSEIVEYTKECDTMIKEVIRKGRQSTNREGVPKKTQDMFLDLIDYIEKLVKQRRKVVAMETEGRLHSLRILKQCRDFLKSRTVVLHQLNSVGNPGTFKTFTVTGGQGEEEINLQRKVDPENGHAIMFILDSLELLEKELHEYTHQEVTLTDKYQSEMRRKYLNKRAFVQGFRQMNAAFTSVEKNPQFVKDSAAIGRYYVKQMYKEYGECMVSINKLDIEKGKTDTMASPKKHEVKRNERQTDLNGKQAGHDGKMTRSNKTTTNKIGLDGKEISAPNQILNKVKQFFYKYEELKNEDMILNSEYHIELSKRKREMNSILKRMEDQEVKLKTQLKETEADKDMYKKLYNDTLKNTENEKLVEPLSFNKNDLSLIHEQIRTRISGSQL